MGPPKVADDATPAIIEWTGRFLKLRQDYAAAVYDLARRAAHKHLASLAYQAVIEAIRADPDHEGARRVFGYQKYRDQWRTAYDVKKLHAGLVWSDRFGWMSQTNADRYENGERLSGGRWISAEADARLHRNLTSGWDVETEHYVIRTDVGIEAAVALGEKLENLNRIWQQMFIRYYASEAYVEALLAGKGPAHRTEPLRFQVNYFRDRDEYNQALRGAMPDVGLSTGIYLSNKRAAYFFAGGEATDRVMYHEATHQLFHQSRRVAADVGHRANFWLVEGIAMYMESLHREDGYYVLGGLDTERMTAARYHLFKQDFYVPFGTLTAMGMATLQSHPKIAKLYSQMAAMTTFLVHGEGGRYRDALVAYLAAVYNGSQDPGALAELTGVDYAELDRQYQAYMKIGIEQPASQ